MPARNSTLETRAAVSLLLDGAPHELVAAVCPPLTPANHKKFALDADTYLYHQTRAALDLARDVLGPAELRKHQALSAAEAGMLQIPSTALRSWCATFIAVPHPGQVVVRGFRPRPDHVLAALAALKKRERKLVAAKPSPQLSIPLVPLGPDVAFGDEADELDAMNEDRARSKPAHEPGEGADDFVGDLLGELARDLGLEPAPEPELEPASAPAPELEPAPAPAPELEPAPEPEPAPKPESRAPRRRGGKS